MTIFKAIIAVTLLFAPVEKKSDEGSDSRIDRAIAAYQPLWMPPEKSLERCVVGIDAVGGGASDAAARDRDDLGLLTAEYLYHFVRRAGGVAVMTRSGDYPLGPDGAVDVAARGELIVSRKCDVCLSIRYIPAGESSQPAIVMGVAGGPIGLGGELSAFLQKEVGGKVVMGRTGAEETSLLTVLQKGDPAPVASVAVCEVVLGQARGKTVADPAVRRDCHHVARKLYQAIVAYRVAKIEAAKESPVDEVTTQTRPGEAGRLARSLWPNGDLPPEKLNWFCRMFGRIGHTCRSMTYFEPSARVEDGVVVLEGATSEARLIEGLSEGLQSLGFKSVRNEMRVLPDAKVLGEKQYGVCKTTAIRSYSNPDGMTGIQSQILLGDPVFLLDKSGSHYLIQARDGYVGWVKQDGIELMTAQQFNRYVDLPRAPVVCDIILDDLRIPRGAVLPVAGKEEGKPVVLLPSGRKQAVGADQLGEIGLDRKQGLKRVEAALDMLNVPYVWAGRSPIGTDCSGMVYNVAARVGDDTPARDSWQQALDGELVGTSWHRDNIRAGDLVYFIRTTGRVFHVGIAISPTHVIHSAPPAVQISSLKPGDRLYDAEMDRDFFVAKRP